MRTYLSLINCLLFAFSATVFAHTELKSSSPAEDENLKQSPSELQLSFGEAVSLANVELMAADGKKIALAFTPLPKAVADYSVPLPELESGYYTVSWVALGTDTHKIQGEFGFSIGMDTDSSAHVHRHEDTPDHHH